MSKIDSLNNWPSKRKTRTVFWVSFILAVIFNVVTANKLILSNYPEKGMVGPYPSWWFTFNDVELKSHYAILEEQGTLNTFVLVQYLDFGLMISTGIFFFMLAVIVARLHKGYRNIQKISFVAAVLVALSPVMDFIENIVLLVMLSNHQGFPEWMANVYSGFATAKVGLVTPGLLIILVSGLIYWVRRFLS